ncbi:MAG TPA: N-acetylglucosamine-6-phosphate deacetylase [Terriglobales bacterium]|nr:N-acetylglucosamine-6-phosphate deacetylase [Terriglobales bacterium]
MLAFTATTLVTPTHTIADALLSVEAGQVVSVSRQQERPLPPGISPTSFGEAILAPAYIDLHIHGGGGFDVMDDTADALPAIGRLLARHGVASYFPTTITAPLEQTLRALERLADAVEHRPDKRQDSVGMAHPLGIHLEGPFLSHDRRGVHPPEHLLAPKVATFDRFWQAARGHIRMMTVAPELEEAPELIAEASRRGVCVSLGHSDADFDAAVRGVSAGARHATHTFNAMRPLNHRSPGILGAVLTDSSVSADIIADGVHLHPAIVKLVAHAKGPDKTVLITDATAAAGMPDGHYHLGSLEVEVKDGRCVANGRLAGSVLTMDRAVRNLSRFADWNLAQAISAASRNPAHVIGLANKGILAPGADADFVVLNPSGDVLRTFVGGRECAV